MIEEMIEPESGAGRQLERVIRRVRSRRPCARSSQAWSGQVRSPPRSLPADPFKPGLLFLLSEQSSASLLPHKIFSTPDSFSLILTSFSCRSSHLVPVSSLFIKWSPLKIPSTLTIKMTNKQSPRMSRIPFSPYTFPPLSPPLPHSGKTPVVRGARACTVCRAAKVRIIVIPISKICFLIKQPFR